MCPALCQGCEKEMTMIIDTHTHTLCSDGRKSVADTIKIAAAMGVSLLSITDHDTIDAYPAAFNEAENIGIKMISGIEFSTKDEDGHKDVHVVGLGFDIENKSLQKELVKLAEARVEARKLLLTNVNRLFSKKYSIWEPVEFEEALKRVSGRIVGKPHIASAVSHRAQELGLGITEEELYPIFKLPDVKTKKPYELTMEGCITLIKDSGGIPVLAHPCEYDDMKDVMEKFSRLGGYAAELCKYRYKNKLIEINGLGIEDRINKERELNHKTIKAANKHGLKLTASSDYHAKRGEPGMDIDEYGIDISWLLKKIG